MPKTFDLTLLPLYRFRGNEMPSSPGLLALTPPRRKARSRANDMLIMHLVLGGNALFSTASYLQMTTAAAKEFYNTPGSVTAALRATAITINSDLLERNMEASGQGRYTLATLVLGVVRGEQLYLLEAGPVHAYWMAGDERKDIHDPDMAGRGLGLGQATKFYLSQLSLRTRGRLLIAPELPDGWMPILKRDNNSASLETIRSVLLRQSMDDHNAVLIEMQSGRGAITVLKPVQSSKPTLASISRKMSAEPAPEKEEAEIVIEENIEVEVESHQPEPAPISTFDTEEPAAQAAPSVHTESKPPQEGSVFDSIPRKKPEIIPGPEGTRETEIPEEELISSPSPQTFEEVEESEIKIKEEKVDKGPSLSEILARQSARSLARSIQITRTGKDWLKNLLTTMMPRILPTDDSNAPLRLPNWVMGLIAVIIPIVVVTISSVVYFRFGRDIQYETAFAEVEVARVRALEEDDEIAQRTAWLETIDKLDIAEEYDKTEESEARRSEAQSHLDILLGIRRLNFQPVVDNLPRGIEIKAMVATDTELFMLDGNTGKILRAFLVSNGYQYDDKFNCESGEYNGKNIGSLIALQSLPKTNAMGATVMGIDAQGGLIYCSANQIPQAMELIEPPVGLKEITAISLDSDVLYILDAPSREVWAYSGRASTFIDYPTSFFTQAPEYIENTVDMSVKGSDLYLLYNDGHLASCTYSLLDSVPTRCINPVELVDEHPAAGGGNNFGQALFKEMHISTPPDAALLLFAPDTQAVFRFSPRSFSLQNQLEPIEGSIPEGSLSAMASNPGHILFMAQGDKVYMVSDIQ
ncbi:MAG: hypothetical protein HN392_05995 [Anaerolineae bacterium]|nr:hypothetical protein [Anaerolineae bacterium]MBT7781805.1 hypothetical protein [Anaerolineae bacterium]